MTDKKRSFYSSPKKDSALLLYFPRRQFPELFMAIC
nr:MAG TPA: hypothetical protein [Caudoviricetes sp.]DAZ58612.1 MAG TPA: hypothetical protein [Caudoviricetes sp.]